MLYDKRWDRTETKPDVFLLESLIAWLEKQPARKAYNYSNNCGCMLHQYFSAMSIPGLDWIGGWEIHLTNGEEIHFSDAFADIAVSSPRTFGAALKRARAATVPSAQRGEV